MNAADELIEQIDAKKSYLVIGLDPNIYEDTSKAGVPHHLVREDGFEGVANAFFEFNKQIIDETHDLVAAYKPNFAFYVKYGVFGVEAFKKTVDYIKNKGCMVIGDAKENEIGNSAMAYSDAFLGETWVKEKGVFVKKPSFDVNFLTVNPYLGRETLEDTFAQDCQSFDKGVFVLIKTSNKGSGDLQDKLMSVEDLSDNDIGLLESIDAVTANNSTQMYNHVALSVRSMGEKLIGEKGYSSIGAVVGATYPEQAKLLRKLLPNTPFLVPGYGAQGAKAQTLANFFNEDGLGAIINSSRGIIFSYKNSSFTEEEFAKAARKSALDSINDINKVIESTGKYRWNN